VMADIRAATKQQSVGLDDIKRSIDKMDAMAQATSKMLTRAAAAAEAVQDRAGTLAKQVAVFKLPTAMVEELVTEAGAADADDGAPFVVTKPKTGFQPRIIRFGYGLDEESHQGRAVRLFAQDLADRTGGRLKVKEVGNARFGSDDQMQNAMLAGKLDMMAGGTATLVKYVPELAVFDLPFLFDTELQADFILDGPLGQSLADKLSAEGLVGLVYWENGFRSLTTYKRPVRRIEDLKGLKLRVMQNTIFLDLFRAFGAEPVALPFSELGLALETRQVDGQENPVTTIQSSRFYEAQTHLTLTRHVYSPWLVTASRRWWDSLSDDEHKAIQASAAVARDFQRRDSRESSGKAMNFLREQGMEIITPEVAELTRMREVAAEVISRSPVARLAQEIRQSYRPGR